jgi:hypothetical protein
MKNKHDKALNKVLPLVKPMEKHQLEAYLKTHKATPGVYTHIFIEAVKVEITRRRMSGDWDERNPK